jgi:prevent-host-death family protein
MAEIGIKELKSGVSRVVDDVAGGRSYVITKRGEPTAVLMPVEEAADLVLPASQRNA